MVETNMQFNDIYQALTEIAEQKKANDKPRPRIGFVIEKQNEENAS
jgi:RNase P protein component